MRLLTKITIGLMASAIVSTPAMAQQKPRKTLFDHLFPKAYEKRIKRLRAQQGANLPAPKVAKTKYYTYKTLPVAAVSITPFVEVAVLEEEIASDDNAASGTVVQPVAAETQAKPSSLMTSDLELAAMPKVSAEKFIAKAVSEFYDENQTYHWVDENGEWRARARAVLRVLENAEAYGLRSEDYLVEAVKNTALEGAEPAEPVENELSRTRLNREIMFTIAVLRYAMDAEYGTINANNLSGYHDIPVHYKKAPEMLEKIMGRGLASNTLRSFHPKNEKFAALKKELHALRLEEDDAIELPDQVLMKPGKDYGDLPLFVAAIEKRGSDELRAAHQETLQQFRDSSTYNEQLEALVKAYQAEAGLTADGVIGPATSKNLQGTSKQEKVQRVVLAMERLRWLPNDLGARHVFINQPEFRARYIEEREERLAMRVVVGKKSNQTNFFYDEIEQVVYNPYWGVPRSILVNEYLPKLRANPAYLDQIGYEVSSTRGRVSSASVNWNAVGATPSFSVRQPPGPKNALGEVKILFPNKHAIYMHDTPSKHLFKRDFRAYSHGCIRLHDPKAMAAAVLGKTKGHVTSNISTGKNQTEFLETKIPVYVSYFTAWPQADGTVEYFGDMYGRDTHLWKAFEATREARGKLAAS